jgi:hypothetical protein
MTPPFEWYPEEMKSLTATEIVVVMGASFLACWAWSAFDKWRMRVALAKWERDNPPPMPQPPLGFDLPIDAPVWVRRYSTQPEVYRGVVKGYAGDKYIVTTDYETSTWDKNRVFPRTGKEKA